MPVSPHEFFVTAKGISGQAACEADYRTVISRAYYAAYHAAKNFHSNLPSPGSVGSANGLHEQLAESLCNPSLNVSDARHLLSRKVGMILRDMHKQRVIADYKIDQVVTVEVSNNTLEVVGKLLGMI